LKGYVVQRFFRTRLEIGCFDHNADLAAHMNICFELALGFEYNKSSYRNFFADNRRLVGNEILNGFVAQLHFVERVNVRGLVFRNDLGNAVHDAVEFVAARHEVAFAVDFEKHAHAAAVANVCAYNALGGNSAFLFNRFRNAALS
jgi:hypothetical protein